MVFSGSVCRYWVVTRLWTGCMRPHRCVRETCVRWLDAAWGVGICTIIVSFARVCRVGVWFRFTSALLLAEGGRGLFVRPSAPVYAAMAQTRPCGTKCPIVFRVKATGTSDNE